MNPVTYPVPGVMLSALQARFGHPTLKTMISAEVVRHGAKIMRMQAVANLWERHIARQYIPLSTVRRVCSIMAAPGPRRLTAIAFSSATPGAARVRGFSVSRIYPHSIVPGHPCTCGSPVRDW